jgi:hypothetical protein
MAAAPCKGISTIVRPPRDDGFIVIAFQAASSELPCALTSASCSGSYLHLSNLFFAYAVLRVDSGLLSQGLLSAPTSTPAPQALPFHHCKIYANHRSNWSGHTQQTCLHHRLTIDVSVFFCHVDVTAIPGTCKADRAAEPECVQRLLYYVSQPFVAAVAYGLKKPTLGIIRDASDC